MPIVKRYKSHVPVGLRDWEQETTKVFLDPKTGYFEIDLPGNICDVVRSLTLPEHLNIHDQFIRPKPCPGNPVPNQELAGRRVVGKSLEKVMDAYKHVCLVYSIWMQDNVAEHYLSVIFGYNVRHTPGFHDAPDAPKQRTTAFSNYGGGIPGRMSFAACPAMEMSFKSVWRIDGKFYTKGPEGRWYAEQDREADKIHRLRWTQEREDFLSRMDTGLTGLICRLMEFFEDIEGNMDLAIETGIAPLSLTGPRGN